jgi:hypothetical protein
MLLAVSPAPCEMTLPDAAAENLKDRELLLARSRRLLRRRPSVVKGGGPDLGVRHDLPRNGRRQVNSGCAREL